MVSVIQHGLGQTSRPPIAASHKIDIIHPLILSMFGLNAFLNRLSLFENV